MKRDLHRWAYAAVGIMIIIAVLIVRGIPEKEKTHDESGYVNAVAEIDALRQFGIEKEQLRSMQLAQLDEIINSEKSSEVMIDSAQREKLKIVERMETEQLTEGILRARGYTDAAVTHGEGYMTVMIRAQEVSQTDAARITELITRRTGVKAENIKIIPIN